MPENIELQHQPRAEDLVIEEAGRCFGLVPRERCRALGMSDSAISRRISRGTWRSRSGVLILPGHPACWERDLMLVLFRGGPGTVASHRAAAALLNLDGIPRGTVEVYARSLRTDPTVRIHRASSLPPCDVTRTGPLIHTDASRTLLDLGAVVDEGTVEMALECALRRRLTSIARLRWRLDEIGGRGRRGAATLRKLLNERDPAARPAQSVLEVCFIQGLRRSGLPPYVRQHEVLLPSGKRRYIDFAFPHAMLGVEVGGRATHTGPVAEQSDSRRHNELTRLGWTVLYFSWDDVDRRMTYVIDCIRSGLAPQLGVR